MTNRLDIDLPSSNLQELPVSERINGFLQAAAQTLIVNEDLPAFGHRQFLPAPPVIDLNPANGGTILEDFNLPPNTEFGFEGRF